MIKTLRYSLLSLLVLVCGSVFAQKTVIFDATVDSYGNNENTDNIVLTKDGVTLAVTQGNFGNGKQFRIFKGHSITVSAESGNVTSIVFTCTASNTTKYGPGCFAQLDGYTYDEKVGTWVGSAPEVTFSAESNQVRATKIEVTVAESGQVIISKPTVSGAEYFLETTEVTLEAAEGDIYYTIDGTEPTAASTKYEAPFTLDASATVKAIAVKDGKESAVVEKAFEKVVPNDIVIGNVLFMDEPVKWQRVYFSNSQVVYVKGSQVYIREAQSGSGAAIFYNVGLPAGIKRGDILNGSIIVDYTLYNEMPEFISNPLTDVSAVTIDGTEEIIPVSSVTIEDLETGLYKCNDVLMQGQIVTGDDGKYYLQEEGGKTILFYGNDEAVSEYADNGKTYFVESIYYGIYKGTYELLPISVYENDPTAISDVKAETNANGAIFNLAGQRMSKLSKGINIVNGKKIIK